MCFRHFLGKHVAKKLAPPPVGKKTRPPCRCVKKTRPPCGYVKKLGPLKTSGPQAVNSEPSLKWNNP